MIRYLERRIPGETFQVWANSRPFSLSELTRDGVRAELGGAYGEAIPGLGKDNSVEFTDKHGTKWAGHRVNGKVGVSSRHGDTTENSEFRMNYQWGFCAHSTGKLIRKVTKVEGRKKVGVLPITLERQFNDSTTAGKVMDHIKRLGQAFRERDTSQPEELRTYDR